MSLENSPSFPTITRQHIQHCQFSNWFPIFKRVSISSLIIKPLPQAFIDYLNADSIYLSSDLKTTREIFADVESDDEDEWKEAHLQDEGDSEQDSNPSIPSFPELLNQIQEAILQLGGSVFPKLNWSSPKDATWIAPTGTLQCTSPDDILLLLKSSDFIAHDIGHAFDLCGPCENDPDFEYELVLRKWVSLIPSMEFRCFVKNNLLLGMCQRDYQNYYSFLVDDKDRFEKLITDFFNTFVQGKFPEDNYVFDVYINQSNSKVSIIDFNPFSQKTDSLLFTWNELLCCNTTTSLRSGRNSEDVVEEEQKFSGLGLRVVSSQQDSCQLPIHAMSSNRLPKDVVDMSQGHNIAEFVQQFQAQVADASVDR